MKLSNSTFPGLARVLTCALGLVVLSSESVRAQYLGAGWNDYGFGAGAGFSQGLDVGSFGASTYDFGLPGFSSDSYSYLYGFTSDNPHFGLGYASGVEIQVKQ
jgi:hypothetical protein